MTSQRAANIDVLTIPANSMTYAHTYTKRSYLINVLNETHIYLLT